MNKVRVIGELRPKSKFLGNSVSTVMEGENRILLMGKEDEGGKKSTERCHHPHILASISDCSF